MKNPIVALDKNGDDTALRLAFWDVHGPDSRKDLLCGTAHVWIYNSKGNILLQKRGPGVSTYPNCWDISAAGHIDLDETPIQSAIRETKEEIGLEVMESQLEFIKKRDSSTLVIPGNWTHDEYAWVYLLKSDEPIESFIKQKEEVDSLKWIDLDVFNREVHDKELSKKYVPHGEYYDYIISEISKRNAAS